ncbi:hypothetical protein JTE90_015352 [Oedothorax gibbosus]|uniref:Neurotrophin-3 n=1 Tax=Oedothorax gibbosus TaxID=931172 RepID=A0AAV6TII7_9ARAC|nr:hypothetical protein JTE90_015352 [Oedothorax gibbosus]
MASSIQKLVCDLQQVQEYLDVNNLKTNFDSIDRRIRIQAPDYSTIEESASRTTLEVDLTLAEDRSPSRSQEVSTDPADSLNKSQPTQSVVERVKSPGYRDDDMTEIYDHNATLMKVGPVAKGI